MSLPSCSTIDGFSPARGLLLDLRLETYGYTALPRSWSPYTSSDLPDQNRNKAPMEARPKLACSYTKRPSVRAQVDCFSPPPSVTEQSSRSIVDQFCTEGYNFKFQHRTERTRRPLYVQPEREERPCLDNSGWELRDILIKFGGTNPRLPAPASSQLVGFPIPYKAWVAMNRGITNAYLYS
jgi:hypothetical protein